MERAGIKMKSNVRLGIAVGLMIFCVGFTGCASNVKQGVSDTEVLTLTEVPEDKMMITMRMGDGMNYKSMKDAIESKFEDVCIVSRSNSPVEMSAKNHDSEDIILSTGYEYTSIDMEEAFIDLSGESFIQNYYLSMLQEGEVNGKLYFLPGPSNIYGIVYNKDMFEENGWEVPDNLDEFITLCQTIDETGIRAIQPALYYTDAASQFFTGFTYKAVLAGTENEKWFSDYKNGETVMKGHMEPAFDIIDRLIEAGILRVDDFEMQPVTRSNMLYKDRTCAMILETQAASEYVQRINGADAPRIGLMPFYSGSDKDSDYFLSVPVYNIAISKSLENKGNEKKLKKAKEILEYLSTAEGQKAVMGDNTSVISSVKGIKQGENEFLKAAEETIDKGHVVRQVFYAKYAGTGFIKKMKEGLLSYVEGRISREQMMDELDKARDGILYQENVSETVKIGKARETFSIMQTACLISDIFREKTNAEIGLCAANMRNSGNNWKIYKGDILYNGIGTLDTYLDMSFLKKTNEDNNSGKLLKVKMTGKNILKALNSVDMGGVGFPDAYFTASGLKITFAPWAQEGKRYVSVMLSNGKAMDLEQEYTVALWVGAINEELIESIVEVYDVRVADLLKDRIEEKGGVIEPENKDFILDWKTR